jgi:transcription antitermination factor NusG
METEKHDWLILELSHSGEQKADDGTLQSAINKDLSSKGYNNHPVFIPAVSYTKAGRTVTIHLMEGYAFIKDGLPFSVLQFIENRGYVTKILTRETGKNKTKEKSLVTDSYIKDLQLKLRSLASTDFKVGSKVVILEGPYTNLEGEIVDFEDDKAFLRVCLRSLTVITLIPKIFIDFKKSEVGV